MTTVAQLEKKGYEVGPATEVVGCTSVRSAKPFWFFNPRFHKTMEQVHSNTQAAMPNADGSYGILVAGTYAGDTPFPFELLDINMKAALNHAAESYAEQERARRAAQDGMDQARVRYETLLQKVMG